jgi:Phage integrase family
MLLAELCDQLLPVLKPSVRKDVKTTVGYLAKALNCPDPQHCPLELYNQPLPTLYRLVEDYLSAQGKSPDTIRNTKNFTSRLFRLAAHQQLFSPAPVALTRRFNPRHRPLRPGADHIQTHATLLRYAQWPLDLQHAFMAFHTWATAPVVTGRAAHLRKRLGTVHGYKILFEGYFGYLYHTACLSPTFDHLFDLDLVTAYVQWHVNDCHHKVTRAIHAFLTCLLALTQQYRPMPALRTQLTTLQKTLPVPPPTYDKSDAWVPLATLDEIGRSLWPQKQPHQLRQDSQRPGLHHAVRASLSLMLRLWTYIPYRQRNMREMQRGDNLHKDDQGHWHITFRGEQLKVATKHGRTNVFDLHFPATLVPLLEDYLATWRPILLARASHPDNHVFLTQYGTPYKGPELTASTKKIVYRYTGKHWHPHIIRTVWATEMIRKGLNFLDVAKMLNDRLETVIAKYTHLVEEDVTEKAYRLTEEINGQRK